MIKTILELIRMTRPERADVHPAARSTMAHIDPRLTPMVTVRVGIGPAPVLPHQIGIGVLLNNRGAPASESLLPEHRDNAAVDQKPVDVRQAAGLIVERICNHDSASNSSSGFQSLGKAIPSASSSIRLALMHRLHHLKSAEAAMRRHRASALRNHSDHLTSLLQHGISHDFHRPIRAAP